MGCARKAEGRRLKAIGREVSIEDSTASRAHARIDQVSPFRFRATPILDTGWQTGYFDSNETESQLQKECKGLYFEWSERAWEG